jgi:hypothetical protein
MTHEKNWNKKEKAAPDNVHERHVLMGARVNANEHLEFYRNFTNAGPPFVMNSINTETIAATKTLTVNDASIQFIDPGGANRDIVLPAEASSAGYFFFISNREDVTGDLVVKNDGGDTIATVTLTESALVICDGTNWAGGVLKAT